MRDNLEFLATLEKALDQRREYLDNTEIPRLKDSFHAYQTALKNVLSLLLRKSFLREDPYKNEQKISEIALPPTDPVAESEKVEEISLRLSHFETQLDYLNNFYQFSVEFLNLRRVRLLSKLVRYITWDNLSGMSGSFNTRLVAELFSKVRQGGDTLSAGVINDAQNQLVRSTEAILDVLRDLTSYQRERYKLEIRKGLFSAVDFDARTVAAEREQVLRKLKGRFAQLAAKGGSSSMTSGFDRRTPYYPELISEILDEDYSEYGAGLRDGILEKLKIQVATPPRKKEPEFKPMLLEAVRLIGTAGIPMESALQKLVENAQQLEQKKLTMGARIRLWFTKLVGSEMPTQTYEIELSDPDTAVIHVERLDFKVYAQLVVKRCKILENISNKMSDTSTKLADAEEEQIQGFLSSTLNDVYALFSKMPALDNFFKAKLGREDKVRLKGIKMEVNAIKNAVVKSNQKMHEYLSRKEEEEQLKRLGITDLPAG